MSAFLSSLRPAMRATSGAAQAARSFSSSSSRSVAKMFITGRLATEPELQVTASGTEIVKYSVATQYYSKGEKPTSYFKVSVFPEGGQKDFILGLPKGTLVFVEGDAAMRTYEDGNGNKRSSLNILQRTLEVLRRPYIPTESAEGDEQGTN
ncbi:single-stranded DNA-binding protein [Aspergillus brunneoviolaceus CBS 621.78]|uniref:Nucleic acid-binding protein n=2 Tax=Aspergillus TaxID=5052 RepID=A0A8G1RF67_9EURO|nr:nucleic acid-binding protein [Aspergillus brunneoviolaceus CBS 621.78]XP_040796197.1 nucleic acid-binding protein [Aspergillus fijiensis CBS 313.89]RAH47620.1 nucleic acid-binding protein [Aspergillus brunneoviolaceus CBS 621.78]RAK72185.1 nucleic acid-binding protein [Aspergillus fijiensis CBS 313.89]